MFFAYFFFLIPAYDMYKIPLVRFFSKLKTVADFISFSDNRAIRDRACEMMMFVISKSIVQRLMRMYADYNGFYRERESVKFRIWTRHFYATIEENRMSCVETEFFQKKKDVYRQKYVG